MPITFACPSCEKRITAPDALAGRRALCPSCKLHVAVPGGTESPYAPTTLHEPADERILSLGGPALGGAKTPSRRPARRAPDVSDRPRRSPWPLVAVGAGLLALLLVGVGVALSLGSRPGATAGGVPAGASVPPVPADDGFDPAASIDETVVGGVAVLKKTIRLEERRLVGTVVNRSAGVRSVSLTWTLHDEGGAQVDRVSVSTGNLAPGVEWKFRSTRIRPGLTFRPAEMSVR